jgi:hypothetical protein
MTANTTTTDHQKGLFDQSFDIFNKYNSLSCQSTDPWPYSYDDFWNSKPQTSDSKAIPSPAATASDVDRPRGKADASISKDPFSKSATRAPKPRPMSSAPVELSVKVYEQLSTTVDGSSAELTSSVEGSIYISRPSDAKWHICLTVQDLQGHLESLQLQPGVEDITRQVQGRRKQGDCNELLHPLDRIFRVSHSEQDNSDEDFLIARYICMPRLRPVPLVSEMRVSVAQLCSSQ